MPKRTRLTDEGLRRLRPPKEKDYQDHFDSLVPRMMLTVYRSGRKAWHVQYYVGGKVHTRKLGEFPILGIKAARDAARKFQEDPQRALAKVAVGSFGEIAAQFMKRHVEAKGLRSAGDFERNIRYCGRWRDRPFLEIRRVDVVNLLDEIEDKHSPSTADGVLSTVRTLFNWFATRSDDYVSPIVRGMSRAKSQARSRILDDDELRAVWSASDGLPIFGDFLKVLLLSAQRRSKVASMKWTDIDENGVWTIATEAREKANPGALVLPAMAIEVIKRQPRICGNPFVFAGRGGNGPIAGFNKRKMTLDAKLGDIPPWTLHDLRRTARSLLSRAGVRPEIAERVLGHAIGGIEGVYDRHDYLEERGAALRALAGVIHRIIAPTEDNVIALRVAKPT